MNYSKNSCTFSCRWPMCCQKWNEKLGCLFQDRKVIVIVAYCRCMCIANTLYTCTCKCIKYELETWSNKLQCLPAQPLLCHLTTKQLARNINFSLYVHAIKLIYEETKISRQWTWESKIHFIDKVNISIFLYQAYTCTSGRVGCVRMLLSEW